VVTPAASSRSGVSGSFASSDAAAPFGFLDGRDDELAHERRWPPGLGSVIPPEQQLHGEHEGNAHPLQPRPARWEGAGRDLLKRLRRPRFGLGEETCERHRIGAVGGERVYSKATPLSVNSWIFDGWVVESPLHSASTPTASTPSRSGNDR
jgi:hypothetical protein